jgi:hypothetical protein
LRIGSSKNCDDVRELAEKKIKELEDKIEQMKRIKLALKNLSIN